MAARIEPRECIYVSLWSLFSGGWCRAVTTHLSFSLPINVQALSRLGGVSLHSGLPFEGLCGMATYSFQLDTRKGLISTRFELIGLTTAISIQQLQLAFSSPYSQGNAPYLMRCVVGYSCVYGCCIGLASSTQPYLV